MALKVGKLTQNESSPVMVEGVYPANELQQAARSMRNI